MTSMMTDPTTRPAACPPWCEDHSETVDRVDGSVSVQHSRTVLADPTGLRVVIDRFDGCDDQPDGAIYLDGRLDSGHGFHEIEQLTAADARRMAAALLNAAELLDGR